MYISHIEPSDQGYEAEYTMIKKHSIVDRIYSNIMPRSSVRNMFREIAVLTSVFTFNP